MILDSRGAPIVVKQKPKAVRATYDAARTNSENQYVWSNADALSARAAHSPAVRRTLRMRSRYALANCPLARGILRKLADFVVGTGPRLQVATEDREYNRAVETAFGEWMIATKFARKLWQMRFSKAQNGEAFGLFFTNLPLRTPVKLDMRTVESDQIADPTLATESSYGSDGIVFDDFGNPIAYRMLRQHPGDTTLISGFLPTDVDTVPAANMVHYFHAERPGQVRGVPEIAASLQLIAMRNEFFGNVLAAADTAARHAGVIESQSASDDPEELEPLDPVDLERRMFVTMPKGWKMSQLKAEQPTTTMQMFDRVLVGEIARDFGMPYGLAACDSSEYNFASAKIDQTPWYQTVRIEQDQLEDDVIARAFKQWHAEARLIPGYLPPSPLEDKRSAPPARWFWDGQELLDPREAGAKAESLNKGFGSLGRMWARQGHDPQEEIEADAKFFGIDVEEHKANLYRNIFMPPVTQQGTVADDSPEDKPNGSK